MGVQTRIVLFAPSSDEAESAAAAAFARIGELDAALSDYRPASDLNRVNAAAGSGKPVDVSPDLIEILDHAITIARLSRGGFDPTIGACTQLWRSMRASGVLASDEELAIARATVGWTDLRIDREAGTAALARPGARLDLGGIAKGHAAEHAARVLFTRGYRRCLVSLSGDVFAGDPPPGQAGWPVTLAGERGSPRPEPRVILIANGAVSTAGDAEQRVELSGRSFSHIIDPDTGLGSPLRRAVTVIAPHGWQADGLDTAAYLLGPSASGEMLTRFGAAGVFDDACSGRAVAGQTRLLRWAPGGRVGNPDADR